MINIIHIEPIPGHIKYLLNKMGRDFGPSRLPIHPVSPKNAEKIDTVMQELELV